MRWVMLLIGLILFGAVMLGVALSGADVLSPISARARARRFDSETAMLNAQNTLNQRRQEVELALRQQEAAIMLEVLHQRQIKELKILEDNAKHWRDLIELCILVTLSIGGIAVLIVALALSDFLISRRGRQHTSSPAPPQQPNVSSFIDPIKRRDRRRIEGDHNVGRGKIA